jgi:hypothetical protein
MGAIAGRRRRVGVWGVSLGSGLPFYRVRWRDEGLGCLQWPAMKQFNASRLEGTSYWGNEVGGHHLMGEMKEEVMQRLFPCSKGRRRRPWRWCEIGNGGGGTCSAWLEVEEAGWAKKAKWASCF